MSNSLIKIIIGAVLVSSVGVFVFATKTPVFISKVDEEKQTVATKTDNNYFADEEEDEEEYDDDNEGVRSVVATSPVANVTQSNTIQSTITLFQIAQHSSRASCWSAISGGVYDLTGWIPNHPGGEKNILSICGTDGSAKYDNQHGGSSKITKILFGFKIGTLTN